MNGGASAALASGENGPLSGLSDILLSYAKEDGSLDMGAIAVDAAIAQLGTSDINTVIKNIKAREGVNVEDEIIATIGKGNVTLAIGSGVLAIVLDALGVELPDTLGSITDLVQDIVIELASNSDDPLKEGTFRLFTDIKMNGEAVMKAGVQLSGLKIGVNGGSIFAKDFGKDYNVINLSKDYDGRNIVSFGIGLDITLGADNELSLTDTLRSLSNEIGRASCRERV